MKASIFVLGIVFVAGAAVAAPQSTCGTGGPGADAGFTPANAMQQLPWDPAPEPDATCPAFTGPCNALPGCRRDADSCYTVHTGDNICDDGSHALNCGNKEATYTVCACEAVIPGSFCANQQVTWGCF